MLKTRSYDRVFVDRTVLTRIKAEFGEMHGFSPTLDQASRLFQLPRSVCQTAFEALTREGFLYRHPNGTYRLTP